jgi:hypothetical protein
MIFSTSIILPVKQASAFTKDPSLRSEHPAGIHNSFLLLGISAGPEWNGTFGVQRSTGLNLKRSLSQDSLIKSAAMIGSNRVSSAGA